MADVVVGAVGKPEFVKADWIKDNAIVVDAGYHNTLKGGVGDIELAKVIPRCLAWTPVPGGVGPMTINTLILQTLQAGENGCWVFEVLYAFRQMVPALVSSRRMPCAFNSARMSSAS